MISISKVDWTLLHRHPFIIGHLNKVIRIYLTRFFSLIRDVFLVIKLMIECIIL